MAKMKMTPLKNRVAQFREKRLTKDTLATEITNEQPVLITMLEELGVDNEVGLLFDPANEEKGSAYVQTNAGSEVWDEDKIIEWLRGRKTNRLWMSCSTRVLDIRKFEAEVAAGNIPKSVVKRMKYETPAAKPFIRFGKNKEGNL